MLYNKFNVDSSSPPDNPPQRPNSDYTCVVATTGQWRVSRCDEQHHVVCQSDYDTQQVPGIITMLITEGHQLLTYSLCLIVHLMILSLSSMFVLARQLHVGICTGWPKK